MRREYIAAEADGLRRRLHDSLRRVRTVDQVASALGRYARRWPQGSSTSSEWYEDLLGIVCFYSAVLAQCEQRAAIPVVVQGSAPTEIGNLQQTIWYFDVAPPGPVSSDSLGLDGALWVAASGRASYMHFEPAGQHDDEAPRWTAVNDDPDGYADETNREEFDAIADAGRFVTYLGTPPGHLIKRVRATLASVGLPMDALTTGGRADSRLDGAGAAVRLLDPTAADSLHRGLLERTTQLLDDPDDPAWRHPGADSSSSATADVLTLLAFYERLLRHVIDTGHSVAVMYFM